MTDTLPVLITMQDALEAFCLALDVDCKRKAVIIADMKQAFLKEPALAGLEATGLAIMYVLKKFSRTKRNQNIRANIRALLKWHYGQNPEARKQTPITGPWGDLVNHPDLTMHEKHSLTRFARYAFLKGIRPDRISDDAVGKFLAEVIRLGTVEDPEMLKGRLVSTWNNCKKRIGGWPSTTLTASPRRGQPLRSPSPKQLGERLAGEIQECLTFLALPSDTEKDGPITFDEPADGGTAPVRPDLGASSIKIYGRYLRRAARIVSEKTGRPYEEIRLCQICEPTTAIAIMNGVSRELYDAKKGRHALYSMASTLATVAKHFFKINSADLARIQALGKKLDRPQAKITAKNIGRLRALVLSKRQELMRLPALLINPVLQEAKRGRPKKSHLLDAEVGVAVAFELNIPLRVGNLAAIRLGKNLSIPQQRGTEGWLDMEADIVKNDEAISRRVVVDLAELLRRYIKDILPHIRSNPTSTALFPGRAADSTTGPGNFGTQITARITRHLGIEMNVHLFRHFTAIMYLEDHPGEYEVVRLLLGNRNLDVIKSYYTGLEKQAALDKVAVALAVKKQEAGLSPTNMLVVSDMAKITRRRSSKARVEQQGARRASLG